MKKTEWACRDLRPIPVFKQVSKKLILMRRLYSISIAAIAVLLIAFHPIEEKTRNKKTFGNIWTVQKTSSLKILGATNVNNFGCDIKGYYQNDTIYAEDEQAVSKLVNLDGSLDIDILKFDCHNKIMTNDLRKILKASEHPNLRIRFLSLERNPVLKGNKDALRGWVEIRLAGTCKRFEIAYTFVKTDKTLIQLNGNREFSFSDFNLVAPSRLGGMVKVKDKFTVDFNLQLDPITR
jgi:hypothetical protein